ncbi:MAG: hypothetical protein JWO07_40 [Candidatus Saccharibacteria bacterium]|nr:hypothetical protein [Candidatus Saccharibacteria bacterium]
MIAVNLAAYFSGLWYSVPSVIVTVKDEIDS